MERTDALLDRYSEAVPMDWIESVLDDLGSGRGGGLFSPALTCWLLMRQRFDGLSVEAAWGTVSPELALAFSPSSKRAQSGVLSSFPGGYGYARQALPLVVAEAVCDRLFTLLSEPSGDAQAFVLDGTSLSPDGSPEIRRAFPAQRSKNTQSHFPCIKVVVAHELNTGLALRPTWGPMYGSQAVSEQELATELAPRLPAGAIAVADRNFGVFSLAYDLMALRHPCVVRLTDLRAQKVLAKELSECPDGEYDVVWQASKWDTKSRPDLIGKSLSGRVVIRHIAHLGPKQPARLVLFVCGTDLSGEEAARLYARRWLVETDLRTLKHSLSMERLAAKTLDVLSKEIILGFAAYNLIRAVGKAAAEDAGVDPRSISFARTSAYIRAFAPRLSAERNPANRRELAQRMLRNIAARLNKPRNRPSTPRQTWHRREKYPPKKPAEARGGKN